jgi:hypothetical protein
MGKLSGADELSLACSGNEMPRVKLMWKRLLPFTLVVVIACKQRSDTVYEKLTPGETGVNFTNSLIYSDTLNVLDFEYLFNGGGVAAGDINNDGLSDLFFTGNMTSSRLYINRGNWKFEDITEQAGVSTTAWCNGVAMVDINQDGFKDIFIAVAGTRHTPERKRHNLLFINNGNNTFTESATAYGLEGTGHNIHAAFLDYDKDGDLDVYVLRNAFVEYSRNRARPKSVKGESSTTDQLFRNNGNNTFTDVSAEAGILIEGFGLGVQVCDINDDGWDDIYVSNDFITNDLLWINNQDGTFSNQAARSFRHTTYNAMGNDLADFNNDGLVDLVEVDMLPEDNYRWKVTIMGNNYDEFQNSLRFGYEPQYVRNTLQLNNGNGTFSDIGYLAGIEATDWSWSALFADYDNDGLKDLFITNGYRQDITNLDFIKFSERTSHMGTLEANKKERLDMLSRIPGITVHKYLYHNNGDLTFREVSDRWGLSSTAYSNGAVYVDLDNDGDLDLVANNIDESASVWRNSTIASGTNKDSANYLRIAFVGGRQNHEGLGAKVYVRNNGHLQYQYFTPFRGFLSSVEPYLHFGLAHTSSVDSLEVIWPDGNQQLLQHVRTNQVLTLNHANAKPAVAKAKIVKAPLFESVSSSGGPDFRHRENDFIDFKVQPLLPHMHSRSGPGITIGDVNADGLEDFFIGGAAKQSGQLFIQLKDGKIIRSASIPTDSLADTMGTLFFDADGDGDDDLYLVTGGTEENKRSAVYLDHLYLNDGSGKFNAAAKDALPELFQSGSCVIASDYDHDGDLDLFVGGRIIPGEYPLPADSYILQNDSDSKGCHFTNVTDKVAPHLSRLGLVTAALWTDVDNDNWCDLLIVGEFMPITLFKNMQGKGFNKISVESLRHSSGWWNSLTAADFDNDGDMDYIAGNLGLNTRYHGTRKEPLFINASDFDKNGSIDPVLSLYINGSRQVAHSWDDLVKQMAPMRARFRTYAPYAEASFSKSFSATEIQSSYEVSAEWFESSYLENKGNGNFTLTALPMRTQIAPVYGVLTQDFDEDGNIDALLIGNSYSTEASTGRYDASIGSFLKGDGKGHFVYADPRNTGFMVDQDAKSLVALVTPNASQLILAGINNSKLIAHRFPASGRYYTPSSDDAFAMITSGNGKRSKHEFYYGSTYLSSGSRKLRIPHDASDIVIQKFSGETFSIKP